MPRQNLEGIVEPSWFGSNVGSTFQAGAGGGRHTLRFEYGK